MNMSRFKSLCGFMLLLVGMNSYSQTRLGLNDLRTEVLGSNLDVQIQYERYYQSQKAVNVALGQFLPSANINMINVSATFAILQSVVPTPSNWFAYKSSQELQMAEKFTSESIKLNILEGLSVTYVNIKYHEAIRDSLTLQETFLDDVYKETVAREEMGLATASDVFLARRNLLQHRQDIFLLDSLIIAEKQALLIALSRQPSDQVILAELPADNLEVIPTDVVEGSNLAINNSTELVSNAYQADAARYMVRSAKWSFVSFNGIGFDYSANIAIERSKERMIELQGSQIDIKIRNQVYAAYKSLEILDQRIALQRSVISSMREIAERNTELYENNALEFSKFYATKSEIFGEERTLVRLEMERSIKIIQIKRLLGLDSSLDASDVNASDFTITDVQEAARKGATHVWLTLEGVAAENIFAVTFSVEGVFTERRVYGADELGVYFKAYEKGDYKVSAKIMMKSGEIINKTTVVTVK